jgi:hypothetical protein
MRRLALVLILPLFLIGCPGWQIQSPVVQVEPQTPRQSLVVAEYTVKGAANTAAELVRNGVLKSGSPEALKAADLIEVAHKALRVARTVALQGGDLAQATAAVNAAVLEAIAYLEERRG